jgi:hypothetical protein
MNELADAIRHIRTVHFTLLVTCLAVFFTGYLNTGDQLASALDELSEVKLILQSLPPDWLHEHLVKFEKPRRQPSAHQTLALPVTLGDAQDIYVVPSPVGTTVRPNTAYDWSSTGNNSVSRLMSYGLYSQTLIPWRLTQESIRDISLADFVTFWNLAHNFRTTYEVTGIYAIVQHEFLATKRVFAADRPEVSPDPRHNRWIVKADGSHFEFTLVHPIKGVTRSSRPFHYTGLDFLNRVPSVNSDWASNYQAIVASNQYIELNIFPDDTQAAQIVSFDIGVETKDVVHESPLARFLSNARVQKPVGEFDNVFPSLANVTTEFRDVRIGQLERIIASLRDRTGETLEIFGVRIPQSAVRGWGLAVICIVQLYLFFHLLEFSRCGALSPDAWQAGWIGLYSSLPTRAFAALSMTCIPAGTCTLVLLKEIQERRNIPIGSIVMVVISYLIAWGSAILLRRIWQMSAARPIVVLQDAG